MNTSMLFFFLVSFISLVIGFISSFFILATRKSRELKGLRIELESQREGNSRLFEEKQGLKQRMLS